MNEVFIDMRKENEWIKKYFNADFVSIEQLLSCIEDLDTEIDKLRENQEDVEEVREFYEKRINEILTRVNRS